jgi:glycine amidinotransferase
MIPAPEPAFDLLELYPYAFSEGTKWGPQPEESVARAKELMEKFAKVMQDHGIRVDRPTPLNFNQQVQTPDWVQDSMEGCMPPRDVLLVVGNEILEATMSHRARWFEYLCYRPLLEQYFEEDSNFLWEAAPKPRLTDKSYSMLDYIYKFAHEWSEEEKEQRMRARQWVLTDKEPLFDAADVFRFGKDLFVQASSVTNASGIDWLKRHFDPKGIRIHVVQFGSDPFPWHIDVDIIAPRPGLLLQTTGYPPLTPEFNQLFKLNGWEVIDAALPSSTEVVPHNYCSQWLANNTLSLDPKTICVEEGEGLLMEQLDKLSFDVIQVPFLRVAPFGGGLHCSTIDVYRQGKCEDYFPKQIPGY